MSITLQQQNFENFPPSGKDNNIADKLREDWFKRKWQLIALVSITLLALYLRLYKLDVPGFFHGNDEGWSFINSAYRFKQIVPFLPPDHTPLFFWINHFYLILVNFTHDKVILRFPTVITGTLIIPANYFLAREISKKTSVALIAAFLAAIVPFLVDLSRYFRMYSLLILLGVLTAYFLLLALRTNKWQAWLGFAVFTSLNLYNHYDSLLLMAELAVFCAIWVSGNYLSSFLMSRKFSPLTVKIVSAKTELSFNSAQTTFRTLCLIASLILIFLLYLPWLSHISNLVSTPGYGVERGISKINLNYDVLYTYVSQTSFGKDLGYSLGLPLSLIGLGYLLLKRFYYGLFCLCYYWLMLLIIVNAPGGSSSDLLITPRYYCFVTPVFLIMITQGVVTLSEVFALGINRVWTKSFAPAAYFTPIIIFLLLFGNLSLNLYKSNQIYQPQRTYIEDTRDFLIQNVQPGDLVLTAASHFESDTVKRNYYISQTLIYSATPDDAHQSTLWPYFLEYEQLNSFYRLQQLQKSHSTLWLLAVPDGTDTEVQASKQKVEELSNKGFTSHCFGQICLIKVNSTTPQTQYTNLKSLLSTFDFLNPDFTNEVSFLNSIEGQKLEQVPSQTSDLQIPGDQSSSILLQLPDSSSSQEYYVEFNYTGQPSKIYVEPETQEGKTLALLPDKHGYTPSPAYSIQTDGIMFEVPQGTSKVVFRVLGEFGPTEISNIKLYKMGKN